MFIYLLSHIPWKKCRKNLLNCIIYFICTLYYKENKCYSSFFPNVLFSIHSSHTPFGIFYNNFYTNYTDSCCFKVLKNRTKKRNKYLLKSRMVLKFIKAGLLKFYRVLGIIDRKTYFCCQYTKLKCFIRSIWGIIKVVLFPPSTPAPTHFTPLFCWKLGGFLFFFFIGVATT